MKGCPVRWCGLLCKFDPAAGFEGGEGFPAEVRPIRDGGGVEAVVDEIERMGISPVIVPIIDFELDVVWHEGGLNH